MTDRKDDTQVQDEVGFVHLHVHSSYSLLEGAIQVGALAKLAAGDGQVYIATDTAIYTSTDDGATVNVLTAVE